MQLAAPVQSAGFPQSYPYAQSMPLPSAILRPLQQPLYDTEYLQITTATFTATANEQIYFQRQLGQTTAFGGAVKTESETNLQQPGQLANPIEFSLFGFYFEVAPDTSVSDFVAFYRQASFTYTYTGNRIYLQIPLTRIPQGVGPEGFAGAGVAADTANSNSMVHNGVGHISNMYKFTIGRSALRIRPTESFQAKVRWPSGNPTGFGTALVAGAGGGAGVVLGTAAYVGTTPVAGNAFMRTRCILGGLTWTAL